ncbi:MAG: type II secretion system minor pseudopilin GspJ [Burkholderiales bacterium]
MKARGFTLLELLVALAIFALLSAIAYGGLNAVLDSREQLTLANQKWRDVTLVFKRIEQDIANAVARPIRSSDDLPAPAFLGQQNRRNEDEPQVALTRTGFGGHSGNLSALQRIGYRLKKQNLEQLLWPVLDQAPRTAPQVLELASDISAFELRYLDTKGTWQPNWPVVGRQDTMPAAVEVILVLSSQERVRLIFLLP